MVQGNGREEIVNYLRHHGRVRLHFSVILFRQNFLQYLFRNCRYTELIQLAEYFLVDVSEFWEYTAELVEPLFEEGVINLKFLLQLSSILNSSLADNFIAAVLKELVKAQVKHKFLIFNLNCSCTIRQCFEITESARCTFTCLN